MKVYAAGKITGLPRSAVLEKFEKAKTLLESQGHEVFVPCILPDYPDVSREDYLHICFAIIDVCDAVYMLADWQQSPGARQELEYARDWKKEIIYQDPSTK